MESFTHTHLTRVLLFRTPASVVCCRASSPRMERTSWGRGRKRRERRKTKRRTGRKRGRRRGGRRWRKKRNDDEKKGKVAKEGGN